MDTVQPEVIVTITGGNGMIYLDSAATSLHRPREVIRAVCEAMEQLGNPGRGAYEASLQAARTVFRARTELSRLFGMKDPSRVVFTANVTEALNLAISSLFGAGSHVITTCLEHNSVLRPLYRQEARGASLTILPCDEKGRLRYDLLEQAVGPQTKGIVCTHASNLTGNLVDIRRIGQFCREHGLLFVVDAAQTAGIFPIDMEKDKIDVLCFTGHKGLLGPQGTGGLCVREGIDLESLCVGGSGVQSYRKDQPPQMPEHLEAGTVNVHGIAGLLAAVKWLEHTGVPEIHRREAELMQRFYQRIRQIEGVTVYGDLEDTPPENRAPVTALNIGTLSSDEVCDELAQEYGIAVRGGAHCAPLMHQALGTEEQGAVRFSFSYFNTEEEIDCAVRAVREIAAAETETPV